MCTAHIWHHRETITSNLNGYKTSDIEHFTLAVNVVEADSRGASENGHSEALKADGNLKIDERSQSEIIPRSHQAVGFRESNLAPESRSIGPHPGVVEAQGSPDAFTLSLAPLDWEKPAASTLSPQRADAALYNARLKQFDDK